MSTSPAVAGKSAGSAASGVLRLAAAYGIVHLCVDLCTVAAIFRSSSLLGSDLLSPFYLVVGYDLIAFGLQLPLGALVDRLRAARAALFVGLALVAIALLSIPFSPVLTMVAAGLGNALFHIAGGALVLRRCEGRAAPSGVFVAPGALGLGAGMRVGRLPSWPVWRLAVALAVGALIAALTRVQPAPAAEVEAGARASSAPSGREWWVALFALLASVAIRSFIGFGGPYEVPRTVVMMIGLPAAGFAGKLVGGFLADRLGWMEASVGALLVSAPFIAFGGSPAVMLAGLLIFQTTMPVTLTAVYLLMPGWPATAFGAPCLALIGGALPTFYPAGQALYGPHTFLALCVTSALAVAVGLRLCGISLRSRAQGTPKR